MEKIVSANVNFSVLETFLLKSSEEHKKDF